MRRSPRRNHPTVVRLTRKRKAAYVRAARPGPLAPWVEKHLDRAAGYKETGTK